jgi:large subunit ribosomal protein L4
MSGGGVALGPKPRSYEQRTPKKMIRLALLSALSDMAETQRIIVLTDWEIEEPDTRAAAVTLKKLRATGPVLCVLANDEIDIALSLRNIPEASITTHAELSAHDVVRADWIIFSERTLPSSPSDFSGTHLRETPPAPTKPKKPPEDAAPAAKAEKAAPAKKAAKAAKATKAAATEVDADTEAPEAEAPGTEAAVSEDAEKPAKKAPARKARATKKAKEGDDADA